MPNNENKQAVAELREKVEKAKSIIFAEFQGLKSNDTNSFRAQMKEAGAEVTVAKNTLLKIALQQGNVPTEQVESDLKGSTVAIFSYNDAIAPLKPIIEFAKKLQLPKVKSAIIDGRYTTASQVEVLSALPTKEVLIGQVVGLMNSPLRGLVTVLNGSQRKLVIALAEVAKKKA